MISWKYSWIIVMLIQTQSGAGTTEIHEEEDSNSTNGKVSHKTVCKSLTCQSTKVQEGCHCDEYCHFFDDCCIDALNKETEILMDSHIKLIKQYASCREFTNGVKYLSIGACPTQYNDTSTVQKCEDMPNKDLRNIAVSLAKRYDISIVFHNKYCAYCHSFRDRDIIKWKISLSCAVDIENGDTLDTISRKCRLLQMPPDGAPPPRTCVRSSIWQCSSDVVSQESVFLCSNHTDPVITPPNSVAVYKNKYCALCNGVPNASSFTCAAVCNGYCPHNELGKWNINILFTFDNDMFILRSTSRKPIIVCALNQTYSHTFKKCLNLECPSGFHLKNNTCTSIIPAITSPHIFWNYSEPLIMVESFDENVMNTTIPIQKCAMYNDVNITISESRKAAFGNGSSEVWDLFLAESNNISNEDILRLKYCLILTISNYCIEMNGSIQISNFANSSTITCPSGSLIENEIKHNMTGRNFLHALMALNQSISITELTYALKVSHNSFQRKVLFCKNDKDHLPLSCLRFYKFDKSQYTHENGITVIMETFVINNDSFFVESSNVYVCADDSTTTDTNQADLFQYLILGLISTSIISLIAVVVIHCRVSELGNLHGKCLVSLCVALAGSQFIWILQPYFPGAFCRAFAIMLHYLWLSVFLWSGIMGFDFARKLNKWTLTTVDNSKDNVFFRRYSLIAWLVPAVVVSVCVVTEELMGAGVTYYGYVTLVTCWIVDQNVRIFAFAAPCAAILIPNMLSLLLVVCGIETTTKLSKRVAKNRKDVCRCLIYFKISVLIGLTWITAYVASTVNIKWLSMLAAIINSLQGSLILVGVLCNGRVMKLLHKQEKDSSTKDTYAMSKSKK